MKFPANCPTAFSQIILSNTKNKIHVKKERVGKKIKIKMWRLHDRGESLGLQVSFEFAAQGQTIIDYPVFPKKGIPGYEEKVKELNRNIVVFSGWLNIEVSDLTSDTYQSLLEINKPDVNFVPLYGEFVCFFREKTYQKEGVAKTITEIKLIANPENFEVGDKYHLTFGQCVEDAADIEHLF